MEKAILLFMFGKIVSKEEWKSITNAVINLFDKFRRNILRI